MHKARRLDKCYSKCRLKFQKKNSSLPAGNKMSLILLEHLDDCVSMLTLNRPDKRNALSIALLHEMTDAIKKLESDRMRRVLIIRGAGPSFCAGLDLKEASDPANADKSAHALADMYLAVVTSP